MNVGIFVHIPREHAHFQFWMLSRAGEIRREEMCLTVADERTVHMARCHGQGGYQQWTYTKVSYEYITTVFVSSNNCTALPHTNILPHQMKLMYHFNAHDISM